MQLVNVRRALRGSEPLGEIPPQSELIRNSVSMAWPSIVESFLIAFVGMVDTMMVGSLGSHAITAVGLCTQPKFIMLAFFMALGVAVSATVARRRGEADQEGANRVLMQALAISAAVTALISFAAFFFADPIVRFTGSAPDTHAEAVGYFRILSVGLCFTSLTLIINAAQRGAGNTRIAMQTNMVSNLVNVFFNYLLIGGNFGFPRLGVRGAAFATVIGTVCGFLMSLRSVSNPHGFLYLFDLHHMRFDLRTLRGLVSVGASTLAEQVFMRFGFLTYARIVAGLGTTAFAAHQIGINLLSLSFSFGDGLSAASIALVGRSLGEQRPDLAKIYGSACQHIGFAFSVMLSVVFLLGNVRIFELFNDEPEVLQYSWMIIVILCFTVFAQISNVIFTGCLRAGGDTFYAAIVALVSIAVIRPLAGWFFCYPVGWGLTGAWVGLLFDQASRIVLSYPRFRGGRWTKISL